MVEQHKERTRQPKPESLSLGSGKRHAGLREEQAASYKSHFEGFAASVGAHLDHFQKTLVGKKPVNGKVPEERRMTREQKTGVVVHHTYEDDIPHTLAKLNEKNCSYHFLITRGGGLWMLHDPDVYLSHAFNHNTGTIGIAIIGGKEGKEITNEQQKTLEKLVVALAKNMPSLQLIGGHHTGKDNQEPRGLTETALETIAKHASLKRAEY